MRNVLCSQKLHTERLRGPGVNHPSQYISFKFKNVPRLCYQQQLKSNRYRQRQFSTLYSRHRVIKGTPLTHWIQLPTPSITNLSLSVRFYAYLDSRISHWLRDHRRIIDCCTFSSLHSENLIKLHLRQGFIMKERA